jgi:hypothetical protein
MRYGLWIAVGIGIGVVACGGCVSVSPPTVRWPDDAVVYQPSRYPEGQWNPRDLAFEDSWFTSSDGTRLHGWYCPAREPRAVVLVTHGNAGNLSDRWWKMRMLQQQVGVASMIFDYRGYGRSDGAPTEAGVLADARAARKWLAERTGVAERDIVLLGESLGGGVAVDLAARDGARALVLESTFTSLPDLAASKLPYTPVRYVMRNRLDSLAKIGDYRGPLLIAHGEDDPLIPIDHARQLFRASASKPKYLLTIPGAGHNWAPTAEYVGKLCEFIDGLDDVNSMHPTPPVDPRVPSAHVRPRAGELK